MDSGDVYKALADQSRRTLLDLLQQRDGQTLSELQAHLPMTRFGCMKHLNILEEAGLITTRKIGREKFHYLNPVPIQQIYDRWVSKYAQPWSRSLLDLKYVLEDGMTQKHSHVYAIYIRTTADQLWRALTDGGMTEQYYFGTRAESSWAVGTPYRYVQPDGAAMIAGEVLESDPPKRLVTTFKPLWTQGEASPVSKVTFEIAAEGELCKLTLIHDDLEPGSEMTASFANGWALILSGLKTLLETGVPMPAGM